MADSGPASTLETWLEESRAWAERLLETRFVASLGSREAGDGAATLAEAMRYAVLGGGKRLRPTVVRITCSSVGGSDADCELPALAVELVHAYSLVHDDLPCMDDDDLRRGRPSCHKVYGEAMAVLVGDALQAKAFELLAEGPAALAAEWTRILAQAGGDAGMVGGQALDMTLAREAGAETIGSMHARKTAALIGAAAEMGAVSGGAQAAVRDSAARWGLSLGLLFQATDDVLDVLGDAATLGKTPGKDERHERASLVSSLGVEGTQARARELAAEARGAAAALGCGPTHPALLLVDRVLERTS